MPNQQSILKPMTTVALPSIDTDAALAKLMRILCLTEERELSCDEAFELVDAYLELEEAGENVLGRYPQIAQHLRLCSDCWDEYLALRECVEQTNPA